MRNEKREAGCARGSAGRERAAVALCALIGAAIGAQTALAQDSVSTAGGLPGDAVSPFSSGPLSDQVVNYVVDLTAKRSSWGNSFAFGPLAKASRSSSTQYFTLVMGAQGASEGMEARQFARASYELWTGAGPGVGPGNSATMLEPTPPGSRFGWQFGAGFMEFGPGPDLVFGNADDEQALIGTVVNLTGAEPNRLYVSRVNALVNKPNQGTAATASFGLGAIDEVGNVAAYADGYGTSSVDSLVQGSLVRVDALARSAAIVNRVNESGFADSAASAFVRRSLVTMTTPAQISELVPGVGRPLVLANDFASNWIYESAPNVTSATKSNLPGGAGSVRGTAGFSAQSFPLLTSGGAVGFGSTLLRTDGNTRTRAVQLFGVGANGAPVGGLLTLTLPANSADIVDVVDGFQPGAAFPPVTNHEFTNYGSQLAFRGGNSSVATVVLPDGTLLVAGLVASSAGGATPQGQDDYLAVARVDGAANVTWRVAAHTGNASGAAGGLSKVIRGDYGADGIPGTFDAGEGDRVVDAAPIGRIAKASEVFANAVTGPSISSAAFDAAGNLYFFATVMLNASAGPEYTTALLRANRNAATGGYELELLLKLGDVLAGANSTRNYQIQYLGVSDSDSGDSASIFSSSAVRDVLPGVNAAGLGYGSPAGLGALVFRAKVVYDFNGDGQYIDPSLTAGSTSVDQAYQVMMVLMPRMLGADVDRSGVVDATDIFVYLDRWFAQNGQTGAGLTADFDANGAVDATDIFVFLDRWFSENGMVG